MNHSLAVTLHAAAQLASNPALPEALETLALALEDEGSAHRLAALNDTCVSPAELEQLREQLDNLAAALAILSPTGAPHHGQHATRNRPPAGRN